MEASSSNSDVIFKRGRKFAEQEAETQTTMRGFTFQAWSGQRIGCDHF